MIKNEKDDFFLIVKRNYQKMNKIRFNNLKLIIILLNERNNENLLKKRIKKIIYK